MNLKSAIFSIKLNIQKFSDQLQWTIQKLSKIINNTQTPTFQEETQIINKLNENIPSGIQDKFTYETIFMKPVPEEIEIFFKNRNNNI